MNRFLIVLIVAGMAQAHSGNRLYPFYELTDEMLEKIDIHDGLIDEWYEIGEPSMTLLDFKVILDLEPLDPSNLDFRVWLAWHDEPDRIYAAFIIADDEYRNEHDYTEKGRSTMFDYDSIVFQLDADHSGGSGRESGWDFHGERFMRLFGETQRYSAVARTASGPLLDNEMRANPGGWIFGGMPDSWKVRPPYGDAGGMVAGENPTVSVIEMYVTPYDWWDAWDDVEKTGFSELSSHQIIGFSTEIIEKDYDPDCLDCSGYSWYPTEIHDHGSWIDLHRVVANVFVDGLLLPAQDTAVESVTWGRIKASLTAFTD